MNLPETKNFYEYLNKKYKIITKKINKLEQTGGTLTSAQIDLANLYALKDILLKKLNTSDKVDFEKIEKPLSELVKGLQEFSNKMNEKLEVQPEANKELLLNEMSQIQEFITKGQDNYLDIKVKTMPKLVHPPLNIPAIGTEYEKILDFLDKSIKELINGIKTTEETQELSFKTKINDLGNTITNVENKMTTLNDITKDIETRIQEINNYTVFKLSSEFDIKSCGECDLKRGLFVSVSDAPNETISMDKLESVEIIKNEEIDKISEQFDKVINDIKIDGQLLIKPDYLKIEKSNIQTAGSDIYLYSKETIKKVINEIFNKWTYKLNEIKTSLQLKKKDEEKEVSTNELIKTVEYLKTVSLKNLSENILILNELILQINKYNNELKDSLKIDCIKETNKSDLLIDLNVFSTKINEFITTLSNKLNKLEQINQTPIIKNKNYKILIKEIDSLNEETNKNIEQLNDYLDKNGELSTDIKVSCNELIKTKTEDEINKLCTLILNIIKISELGKSKLIWEYNQLDNVNIIINGNKIDINDKIKKLTQSNKLKLLINFFSEKITNISNYRSEQGKYKIIDKSNDLYLTNILKECSEYLNNHPTTQISKDISLYLTGIDKHDIKIKYNTLNLNEKIQNKIEYIKKIQKIEFKLLGSGLKNWENYYYLIIDLFTKINKYKTYYNNFRKKAKEFNILYIQLYHHQLYISNYIQIVLLGDTYQIYEYLSKGSTNYYRGVINSIFDKCQDEKTIKIDPVIRYFYKYHYITLLLLKNFLTELRLKWMPDEKFTETSDIQKLEQNKNNSRLTIMPTKIQHTNKMKKGLFIFNLFKDILDSYTYNYASPVAVYLRINDWSDDKTEVFKKNEQNPEKLLRNELAKCNTERIEIKNSTPESELLNLNNLINKFDKIEFNEIFDPNGFNDNATLAMYMNIPTYLSKGRSIMMMTYGYSGVGKTFTLFGKAQQDKQAPQPGILQKALLTIQNKKGIYMRTYEIYGLALPYKSYWNNLKSTEYNHKIYTYNFNGNNVEYSELTGENMVSYLESIKLNNSNGYSEISDEMINSFEIFITSIDEIREKEGRIKTTVNNPSSSRSIMVYEFKILLNIKQQDKYVRFVVMDLPGKEDIKSSYVYPSKTNTELKDTFCINLKKEIYDGYDESAVRASIYLNPIFMSMFPNIANKIIESFKNKLNDTEKFAITTIDINNNLKTEKNLKLLIENLDKTTEIISSETNRYFKQQENKEILNNENYKSMFKKSICASEIMRYLINNNKLNELIDFYNSELLDVSQPCLSKSPASLPFEGFYINENILGLINTIKKRLNPNFKIDDKDVMINFFSENMGKKMVINDTQYINLYEDETIAQTYFIRNLMRENIGSKNNPKHIIDNDGAFLISNEQKYNETIYKVGTTQKSIKEWLENSYDFNKSFTREPPIATFMKSYFDVLEKDADINTNKKDYVINNFYLFFVVSNMNIGKCANQIKLISDSSSFISSLKEYVKPTEEITPNSSTIL